MRHTGLVLPVGSMNKWIRPFWIKCSIFAVHFSFFRERHLFLIFLFLRLTCLFLSFFFTRLFLSSVSLSFSVSLACFSLSSLVYFSRLFLSLSPSHSPVSLFFTCLFLSLRLTRLFLSFFFTCLFLSSVSLSFSVSLACFSLFSSLVDFSRLFLSLSPSHSPVSLFLLHLSIYLSFSISLACFSLFLRHSRLYLSFCFLHTVGQKSI